MADKCQSLILIPLLKLFQMPQLLLARDLEPLGVQLEKHG